MIFLQDLWDKHKAKGVTFNQLQLMVYANAEQFVGVQVPKLLFCPSTSRSFRTHVSVFPRDSPPQKNPQPYAALG